MAAEIYVIIKQVRSKTWLYQVLTDGIQEGRTNGGRTEGRTPYFVAWRRINVMCKLNFARDRIELQIIYYTFIRPILEFSDIVWDNCTQYEKKKKKKKKKK